MVEDRTEIEIDFTQVCRIVGHICENSEFEIYAEHSVAETRHFSEWRHARSSGFR
jgi:hypothetical protein